jgi:glucose-6-phosphate 1-dehydrogenase
MPTTSPLKSDALVLFGATGDLAHKKLFDTLQALYRRGVLEGPVIGVAKSGMTREQVIERAREGIIKYGRGVDESAFSLFAQGFQYVDGDYGDPATFAKLKEALGQAQRPIHYLAIPPVLFGIVTKGLKVANCLENARVVVEKPFGRDLASAEALNRILHEVLDEKQIWARRRPRMSSTPVSQIHFWSRFGTATTSAIFRLRWPSPLAWMGAGPSTIKRGVYVM